MKYSVIYPKITDWPTWNKTWKKEENHMEMMERKWRRKVDIQSGKRKEKGKVAKINCYQEALTADHNPIPQN